MEQISSVFSKEKREGTGGGWLLCRFAWLPYQHNQVRKGITPPGQHQVRKGDSTLSSYCPWCDFMVKLHQENGGDAVYIQTHQLAIDSGSEFSSIDSGWSSWLDNLNLTISHSRCCGGTGSVCFQIQFLARNCRMNHLGADSWLPESYKLKGTTLVAFTSSDLCRNSWVIRQKTMKREVEGINIECLLWAGRGEVSSHVFWREHGADPNAASATCHLCDFGKAP